MPHEGSSLLQKLPSQYIAELAEPQTHAEGWRPKPQVVESLNLADYTHQARCCGCVQNNPGLHASVCEGMGGCQGRGRGAASQSLTCGMAQLWWLSQHSAA